MYHLFISCLYHFAVSSWSRATALHGIVSNTTPNSNLHPPAFPMAVLFLLVALQQLHDHTFDWFLECSEWFDKYEFVFEGGEQCNSSPQNFLIGCSTWRLWTRWQAGFCCPPSMRTECHYDIDKQVLTGDTTSSTPGWRLLWEDVLHIMSTIFSTYYLSFDGQAESTIFDGHVVWLKSSCDLSWCLMLSLFINIHVSVLTNGASVWQIKLCSVWIFQPHYAHQSKYNSNNNFSS